MQSAPLVSVALCTYNGEKYLAEQLDSILSQTYTNLDIVIVDDRSADNTFNIALQYAHKDARVRCFKNEENLGFNKNFEKALLMCKGDYISISDQDDIWEPQKIRALVDNIGNNWLIFSNSAFMTQAGLPMEGTLLHDFKLSNSHFKSILLFNYVTGHTCLMARDFLPYVLPFPATGYYDWWMGFVALYHHKLTYTDQILTRYRIHQSSVIQNVVSNKQHFEIIDFNTTLAMLSNFTGYKGIAEKDKRFIGALNKACGQRLKQSYYLPLITIVYNNYHAFFHNNKRRKPLSKLGFALRYSRRLGRN